MVKKTATKQKRFGKYRQVKSYSNFLLNSHIWFRVATSSGLEINVRCPVGVC